MRQNLNSALATMTMAAIMIAPSVALAQHERDRGGSQGRTSHSSTTRSVTRTTTSHYRGGSNVQPQNRSWNGAPRGGSTFRSTTTVHSGGSFRSGTTWHRGSGGWQGNRPERFSSPRIGIRYGVSDWRRFHPDWNGRYYFNGGLYYYDPGFEYPAVVDNDWSVIGGLFGGAAIIGALDNDPTLFFVGAAGALYSISRYDADLDSGDPVLRARAGYFSKPYFWRDGVRYDRITVDRNGERYYQFHRH